MEHIVQFAIGIDDEAIKKKIEESAEKQIIDRFYKDFVDSVSIDWHGDLKNNTCLNNGFRSMARQAVETVIDEYKNTIIEETAKILADRLLKTKAAKEMLKTVVESDSSAE